MQLHYSLAVAHIYASAVEADKAVAHKTQGLEHYSKVCPCVRLSSVCLRPVYGPEPEDRGPCSCSSNPMTPPALNTTIRQCAHVFELMLTKAKAQAAAEEAKAAEGGGSYVAGGW